MKASRPPLIKACLAWASLSLGPVYLASAVPVTFQVNMEIQISLGVLDPAAHAVEVHGSFDAWGAGAILAPSPANADIYEGTLEIGGSAGSTVEYKFVINQAGTPLWENNGVGPNGAPNRSFTVPGAAQTLPVVYFNNQSTPPGVVAVTFQVNLGIQTAIGNFDPATHTVEAHGSFDAWGAGITLSASQTDSNVYQGTFNISGSAGQPYEHKYVINQAGTQIWEGNVGPGGPFGNRTFTLATGSQTLPLVYFDNLTNNPAEGIPVTFRVNLGVPTALGSFDPATGTIDVRGPFNNWGNPAGTLLTNSPAQPTLYSGTIGIRTASPGNSVPYKFTMNGTWETGDNRAFTLASSAQTLSVDYFDRVANLGPLSLVPGAFDMTLSWTAGPGIRLQTSTDPTHEAWLDVPGTLGQGSAVVFFDPAQEAPGFFRLAGP